MNVARLKKLLTDILWKNSTKGNVKNSVFARTKAKKTGRGN